MFITKSSFFRNKRCCARSFATERNNGIQRPVKIITAHINFYHFAAKLFWVTVFCSLFTLGKVQTVDIAIVPKTPLAAKIRNSPIAYFLPWCNGFFSEKAARNTRIIYQKHFEMRDKTENTHCKNNRCPNTDEDKTGNIKCGIVAVKGKYNHK